jgi:nucleoside-diphosphate-sugar epimerase
LFSSPALQDELGYLIHGEKEWPTLRLPKTVAAAGAWLQDKLEPIVPDAIDQGEAPFVKPFMVRMADDHYALDISRARELLGWEPRVTLGEGMRRTEVWFRQEGLLSDESQTASPA